MIANVRAIKRLVMIGAGGHARVLHALAISIGYLFVGVCDPMLARRGELAWRGIPVLGGDEALGEFDPADIAVVNGIGQLPGHLNRESAFERIKASGFYFPPLVHPAAWVADSVQIDEGAQVMAGATIQPDSCIGKNSIVSTNAGIDHDCQIGAHVHIAPGATLCGGVSVGIGAFVGAGATVIQSITIGDRAMVRAGATLVADLGAYSRVDARPSHGDNR